MTASAVRIERATVVVLNRELVLILSIYTSLDNLGPLLNLHLRCCFSPPINILHKMNSFQTRIGLDTSTIMELRTDASTVRIYIHRGAEHETEVWRIRESTGVEI